MKRILFVVVCLACAMGVWANGAGQQRAWPPRTVELFTPSDPTSGTDAIGQIITTYWNKTYGVNALVNSSNAGGGIVNYERVRNGRNDGSALLLDTIQILLRNQIGFYEHDVWEEFTLISGLRIYNNEPMVAVRADSKYNSLQDLLDDAKARPGMVSCPTGPRGNSVHLRGVGLERDTGVTFRLVDASGDAERISALLGGHVDFVLIHPVGLAPYLENGDVKYLSYVSNERCQMVPDIPCNKELGYPVSLPSFAGLHLIAGPKGMSQEAIDAVVAAIKGFCEDEASREMIFRLEDGYPTYEPREESLANLKALSDTLAKFGY